MNDLTSFSSLARISTGHPVNVMDHLSVDRFIELSNIFLDENFLVKTLPSETYRTACTHDELRVWCHYNSIYQLPTTELIDFISEHIEGKAIEIGSGNGCIGRSLNIPMTDSKIQESDEVKFLYAMYKQPVVKYPSDIIHMEASKAINKYKPNTVVACWVTEWG